VLGKNSASIARCFSPTNVSSVDDVMASLKAVEGEGGDAAVWASETLAMLAKMSPTSVHLTFQQLQAGLAMKQGMGPNDSNGARLRDCLEMEYVFCYTIVLPSFSCL
jgi:hypothetical protein